MDKKTKIIILAAGKGVRMQSELPKALAPISGKPMIKHLVELIFDISNEKPIVIIGHKGELIKNELGEKCIYVVQEEQLGTGHALMCAEAASQDAENIVVLSSDQPFITKDTILNCLNKHNESKAKITFTTTLLPDFEDWRKYFLTHGRILRENNKVVGIKEYRDANEEEKKIKEVNAGCCYIFEAKWLWENIKKLKNKNAKNEYYLTDLIHIAKIEGEKIETMEVDNREALGANSKEELEILEKFVV